MTWVLENAGGVVFIGLAVEAGLLVWLWSSGQARVLWGVAGTAVMTAGLAIYSWSVETDVEQVAAAVHQAAAAVEANDVARVGDMISPSSPWTNQFRGLMRQYRFTRVAVKDNLRVLIAGREATATFNVVVVANGYTYPTVVEVHWVKEGDGRWRATRYVDHGFRVD